MRESRHGEQCHGHLVGHHKSDPLVPGIGRLMVDTQTSVYTISTPATPLTTSPACAARSSSTVAEPLVPKPKDLSGCSGASSVVSMDG